MCLVFIAHQHHPQWRLIVAANRDELHARPTRAAGFWPEQPDWLGGRDLAAGGSWMALSRAGRLALLTNVRNPSQPQGSRSRGELVTGYLASGQSPAGYLGGIDANQFTGFNLLVGQWLPDTTHPGGHWQLHIGSNRTVAEGLYQQQLKPGLHGLSNASLNTPWPKVATGKRALERLVASSPDPAQLKHSLWDLLADCSQAPADQLPDTGVGQTAERLLSSRFIVSPEYGTRASTLLLCDALGHVAFLERSFDRQGACTGEVSFNFALSEKP
ncbi:NRDE family protein [Simiduia sp. 21SJ11W-1]|uniref:NRDE family protein n=1 Tax=Simiduia sp. 21SJ11W-1 TaxID=2909669 RepID=UPI00209EE5EC|nr:NRDE family protein [Simiduia sp. 21SJ11W-1]UTA48114.1 NRDE family protein [Simiduia sp. 21SJ11W-1]